MKYILLIITCLPLLVKAQLTDREISGLKSGRLLDDTSHIYSLPYAAKTKYLFVQGANSSFSHTGELSYDFKMKRGSKICAARAGKIINLRDDSDKGGLKPENLSDGNYIIIQHEDGSTAHYWHLQYKGVAVKLHDTVEQGQLIGYSGNTGYSAFPHLHFQVFDKNNKNILVRFKTRKGNRYIRPGKLYKAI
jgi:murein DD-endopeptidase MepM/ murein hydrolase activator NlpD